jgi:hypothetical protein
MVSAFQFSASQIQAEMFKTVWKFGPFDFEFVWNFGFVFWLLVPTSADFFSFFPYCDGFYPPIPPNCQSFALDSRFSHPRAMYR